MTVVGTREQVWNGEAQRTRGGLTKEGLIKNKRGKLVSKKRSELAAKNVERLIKYQYKKKDEPVAGTRQSVQEKAPTKVVRAVPKRRQKKLQEKK